MGANKQISSSKKISNREYRERLVAIQSVIKDLNYKTLYEYEFNEKLNDHDSILLVNFWNFRSCNEKFLNNFEKIVHEIKNS